MVGERKNVRAATFLIFLLYLEKLPQGSKSILFLKIPKICLVGPAGIPEPFSKRVLQRVNLVLSSSDSSNCSFSEGHSVAAYVFFLALSYLLYFLQ
jgi:hypothetical protein